MRCMWELVTGQPESGSVNLHRLLENVCINDIVHVICHKCVVQ